MILKQKAHDIAKAFTKWNLWKGGSGGSGGASKPYTKTLLYDGAFSGGQIDLLDTYKKFDFIQFDLWSTNNHDFYGPYYLETDTIFLTSEISGMSYYLQPNTGGVFIWIQFIEEKKLNCSASGDASVHKIYGLTYNSTPSCDGIQIG